MTELIKYKYSNTLYTETELRTYFSNVSLPTNLTDECLNFLNVSKVIEADPITVTTPPISAVVVPPTKAEIVAGYTKEVQDSMDSVAKTYGYDNIMSMCTYVTSSIPKFKTEADAGVAWRDLVWSKCYEILAEVDAGTRVAPTDLISEMPTIIL